jgi:hypothetical protein
LQRSLVKEGVEYKLDLSTEISPMNTSNDRGRHPLQTVALFAAGTILATLGAALVARLISERSLEHLARLASGESDYEHKHPSRRV